MVAVCKRVALHCKETTLPYYARNAPVLRAFFIQGTTADEDLVAPLQAAKTYHQLGSQGTKHPARTVRAGSYEPKVSIALLEAVPIKCIF